MESCGCVVSIFFSLGSVQFSGFLVYLYVSWGMPSVFCNLVVAIRQITYPKNKKIIINV